MDGSTGNAERKNLLKNNEANDDNRVSLLQKLKGILAAFLRVSMAVVSATCVQLLQRKIPDFELNTARMAAAFLVFVCRSVIFWEFPFIEKSEILSTVCFGSISFISSSALYVSMTLIPVSAAASLNITSGMLSGLILFALFWEDAITAKNISFVLLCICGVFLVIQPDFIFMNKTQINRNSFGSVENVSSLNETMETNHHSNQSNDLLLGVGCAVACVTGIATSCNLLLLKRHPYLNEHKTKVLVWSFFIGTILSAVVMVIFENPVLPSTWMEGLLVTLHVLPFIFIQPATMYSAKYISGNTFNIVYSTLVVFMLVSQYTVLSSIQPGNRNWMEVVGVVLVLFGSAMGSVLELYKSK